MRKIRQIKQYSVSEINGILDSLRESYDIVRVVDVEECRILEFGPNGALRHGCNCFQIWNRNERCAHCSSYIACQTRSATNKTERLGDDQEMVHSIPINLALSGGEIETCVIECVKYAGKASGAPSSEGSVYINTHDVLTRLYTEEKLLREVRQRLMSRPDHKYLLVLGNIRNFNLVNRLFGVEAGNRVLVGIADALRSQYTDEEVYGRYRDDRFVLFIREDRFDAAAFVRLIRRVARDCLESPIFTLQVKVGVYEIVDPEMPIASMIEHAEEAAASIRDARDEEYARYHPDMMARRLREHQIMASFPNALKAGEFTIYLQPQVRADGQILGAEALVRWITKDGKLLLPGEFLGVLHNTELLSHLDLYVWEQAVQVLRRWMGTDLDDLYISINVDPTDFFHVDVPQTLRELCEKYGVPTSRLRIEITETALIEDIKNQSDMVEQLHRAGFLVEIDDFGKGYSSLSLLKDIHADVLKIDMGFIQSTRNSSRSRIILKSVIGMACSLNMGVITEGVETREQIDCLSGMGCRHFQGFYFSRPVPVGDLEILACENRRAEL